MFKMAASMNKVEARDLGRIYLSLSHSLGVPGTFPRHWWDGKSLGSEASEKLSCILALQFDKSLWISEFNFSSLWNEAQTT
jgi:hypothetical protein